MIQDSIISTLKNHGFETRILPPIDLPVNAKVANRTDRYRADSLLKLLVKQVDKNELIIGLTQADISCTKTDHRGHVRKPEWKYRDWGIFGLGYRPGNACVVSTRRVYHSDETIIIQRMQKIAIHEIGHNLGLHHCADTTCVMQDAVESIKTIDRSTQTYCPACKQKADL